MHAESFVICLCTMTGCQPMQCTKNEAYNYAWRVLIIPFDAGLLCSDVIERGKLPLTLSKQQYILVDRAAVMDQCLERKSNPNVAGSSSRVWLPVPIGLLHLIKLN